MPLDGALSPAPPPKRRHLKALGFARFLASIHVVFGHYFPQGFGQAKHMKDFHAFGGTWVPFFFLLSGFVITYAKLSNPKNIDTTEPLRTFLRKRLTSIYPLFAFSIFCQLLLKIVPAVPHHGWGNLPKGINNVEWTSLPFTLLLLHAWSPYVSTGSCGGEDSHCISVGAWNLPTWFLCCLVLYWIAWSPLYHLIRRLSLQGVLGGMLLCFLYSFLWPVVFVVLGKQTSPPDFYRGPLLDIAKFNPLSFGHIYVWGMLLARLFVEFAEADLSQMQGPARFVLLALRYGASCGYALIVTFMLLYGNQHKFTDAFGNLELLFRCGGLMPFHTLIIWGLSEEKDPVARRFATYPFTIGEMISYPQYVMQAFVQQFWSNLWRPPYPPPLIYQVTQYLALVSTAYVCANYIDVPYRDFLNKPAIAPKAAAPKPALAEARASKNAQELEMSDRKA